MANGVPFTDPLLEKMTAPIDPKTALNYSDISFRESETSPEYSTIDPLKYNKYVGGATYTSLGEPYLNKARAQAQSGFEQFGAMANQALVGQVLGGAMEGIGYLVDLDQWAKGLGGTEQEFGNWFSRAGVDLQTWTEKATEIYRDPDAPKFNPSSWAWWMQNFKSVASTLSLMLPAVGAVKGIESIGKIMGMFDEAATMSKLVAGGMNAAKAAQRIGRLQWAGRGISQAVFSRHMEDMQGARGVWETTYQDEINKGKSRTDATELASKAAANTYKLYSAMLLQDIPQYLTLNRVFGKGVSKLVDQSVGAATIMGRKLLPIIGSKAAAITWDMLGEGFEEGYQFIANQESQYLVDKINNPTLKTSFDKRINKYLQDGDLWTNAFFGAIGAGVMQTAGKAINTAIQGGDPRVKFLKDFGSYLSQAGEAVNKAEIMGSESGHKAAVSNLESILFTKGMMLNSMDDVKELIKRASNPTQEDIERFKIDPKSLEQIGLNKDELLADADYFQRRWTDNATKYEPTKVGSITNAEFIINKFNSFRQQYKNRLQELEPNIINFDTLSIEAQDIFYLSAQVAAENKKLAFQEKRLASTELGKREREAIQKLVDLTKKKITGLESEIEIIEKSRTPEEKAKDDAVDIGGPHNLLDIKTEEDVKKIDNHVITEYRKFQESLTWAEEVLTSTQQRLKDLKSTKPVEKTAVETKEVADQIKEDKQNIPEADDIVTFTKDGQQLIGLVNSRDESNNYNIIPIVDGKPFGEQITVDKDDVVLDKKSDIEEDIIEEPLDSTESPIPYDSAPGNKVAVDIAYMFGETDGAGRYIGVPKVNNEELHKFLVDTKTTLDNVEAEFYIDSESDYAKKWLVVNKVDITKLTVEGLTADVIDNIPIAIRLVKNGKILYTGGMYYHVASFNKSADITNIRRARRFILENTIKGNRVYSDNLQKSFGHFNNTPGNRGNVIKRHGLTLSTASLAVSRKNTKVYVSSANAVPNLSSSRPGSVFAPTSKTPDGREVWAKVDPTKLTTEHAEILWDALVTRYSKGLGGYMAKFPDERVTGLTVGEVINMLVLFGEKKTNIDHPDFRGERDEHLRDKTLYVHSGSELTFGAKTINLFEDNMAIEQHNKADFIDWVTKNKNYSVPVAFKTIGIELNGTFNRTFDLGSWKNRPDENGAFMTYAQILMSSPVDGKSKYAVESDLQEYEKTGSVVVRPHLYLGDSIADIKIAKAANEIAADSIIPKVENTPKVEETKKLITKLSNNGGVINSAYDIINLPVGAIIYFERKEIEGGVEQVIVARIKRSERFGKELDLSEYRYRGIRNEFDNLVIEDKDNIMFVDSFVTYLKTGLPAIPQVDLSNIVENKVPDEVTKLTETKPTEGINTGDTLQDLENIINAPLMEAWPYSPKSIVDLQKEIKWLHDKFGKQRVKETDTLIDIMSIGRKAFGVFTADCIYIFTGAPEGVLYHEAFHRVLLGYLSWTDRKAIYAAARKEYGMPNASNIDLSEKLAESFRHYKLSGAKPKSRTLWQKFTDLLSFIYTYFTGNTRLNSFEIDRLFDSIERGQFRYSKIDVANAKRLAGIQTPMAVEIHRTVVPGINNSYDLDKVVKYLSAILIQTNDIDNLNKIKNIKMKKMFDYIDSEDVNKPGLIQRLRSLIANGQKQLELEKDKTKIEDAKKRLKISENLLNILTIVTSKEYKHLFEDKVGDTLTKLNVKTIAEIDENTGQKIWDKASYEVNSKDNILASIKFVIATLQNSPVLDIDMGISEFVDFNRMWNSIMHNLWDINDSHEMMDRLVLLTDQYPYQKLVEKLNADKSGRLKEQLRQSVQRHRHDFINVLTNLNKKEGLSIKLTSADVSSASKRKILDWNLFFVSSGIVAESSMAGIKVNEKFANEIWSAYFELSDRIDKEYSRTKSFAKFDSIVVEFTTLLNRIGIDVDKLSVEELVNKRVGETKDDKLRQVISTDFNWMFRKVQDAQHQDTFNMFFKEAAINRLAEAHVKTHPEEISDSVLGAGGNLHYVYSQNSYVTDRVRKFKNDRSYLEEHSRKLYSDGSYYMDQLLADGDILEALNVKTFSMFGRGEGLDYLDMNPVEDYVMKLTILRNGLITFPTMADRQTYYLLSGVKPYEFNYGVDAGGTLVLPESVIDIFVGYARSEKKRIERATEVIQSYNAAKETGNTELISQLENQLIEGYHYLLRGKEKDTSKASALKYQHFQSLNDKVKDTTFDFDRDIRSLISETLTNNVNAELDYVVNLGILGVSSYNANVSYYNRLLDTASVVAEVEKYGNQDKALRNIIASNFVNSTIAAIEIEKMFSGDPAFYKVGKDTKRVHEDRVKRLSAMTSTGDNFAENVVEDNLTDSTYNVVTVETQKFPSTIYDSMFKWNRDVLMNRLEKEYEREGIKKTHEELLKEANAEATDKLNRYNAIDPTDGQIWISPDIYKSLSIRLGEWSPEKEVAFDLLQSDRELTLDEEQKTLDVTFQPLKLVYFDLIYVGDLAVPTYDKASFATIFRTMIRGKYGNRQIVDMLDRMELKGKYQSPNLQKVDMFKMDTAVKVGTRKKVQLLDDKFEQFNDLSNIPIHKQSYLGLRRQLTTDTHDVDRVKTGTQFLKIILSNLNLTDAVYTLNGKDVNGKEIANIVFDCLRALSNKGREELEKRLGYANGKVDKTKLVQILVEDAKKSNASDNLIDALSTIGDELYLELDALTDHKWIQNRIVSLISRNTIDINLPGNQLIQFSNFGIRSVNVNYKEDIHAKNSHVEWINNATDDLKWMSLDNHKVNPMECIVSINLFKHIIPNYSNLTFKEKIAFLSDNPELMGYRIPTQGQDSMMMLKVVGVYPETIGDTITLPSEFTVLTDSDFDIDKLYVTRYNYITIGKKLEKVKFIDGDTNDDNVLKSIYKSRFGNVKRKWNWVSKISLDDELTSDAIDALIQIADMTDNKSVDTAVYNIIGRGLYDNNSVAIISDYIDSLPTSEEMFINNNRGKSIYAVNSRKAVENKLLDAFFSVMRSEEHYPETNAPLGPLNEKLRKKANAIREANEVDQLDLYYASPRYNEYVKNIYGSGKDGVGPFALNNNHHVLGQLAGLKMVGSFGDVMYEENGLIDLSRVKGKDKVNILDWLSALIVAHVDVAKDPYITELNVNSYTYNVVALLIRGGFGEATFDFVSQPILKELATEQLLSDTKNNKHILTKRLLEDTGRVDSDGKPIFKQIKALDYVKNKWLQEYLKLGGTSEEIDAITRAEVFGETLLKDAVTKGMPNKNFIKRQLAALNAFTTLKDMGNDLNTLIQASQIDTKAFGSDIVSIRVFINKIRRAYLLNKFVNIEKILPYDPIKREEIKVEGANFLGAYANNSINFALDLFGEFSIYGTDSFEELFEKLLQLTGNQSNIDDKLISVLSDELFAAIVSKFFTDKRYIGIDSKKLGVLFNDVMLTLGEIRSNKGGKYDNLVDNAFIKLLSLQPSKNDILPFKSFISIPNKSIKDKIDKDNMISSFGELVKHPDPDIQNFARRLVYFSFFTSGFRRRLYSFFSLIPNELMHEIKAKDPLNPEVMVDRSYNDFIKSTLTLMKDISNVTDYIGMIDEVLINNHDNDGIIKTVRLNGADLQYTYGNTKYDIPVSAVVTNDVAKTLLLGYSEDGKAIYRPYIKVDDYTIDHVLMRYIGYYLDGTGTRVVYVAENMRSYNALGTVLREYGMDKSIIEAYNKLNVVKDEEKYINELGNAAKSTSIVYVPKSEQFIIMKKPTNIEQDEEQKEDTQEGRLQEIIPLQNNFSRSTVEQDKDYLYLFTDNARRTSGTNLISDSAYEEKYSNNFNRVLYYPNTTQAVIRALDNAFPITTMVDDKKTQWTDDKFDQYKAIIDDEIRTIKENLVNFKGLKFSSQMPFGKGQISNMKESAPKIWNYLNEKLKEIGIDNTGNVPIVMSETIDEFPFFNGPNTVFSTEPESVSNMVTEMGIIDWEKVTPEQWKQLRDAYAHCKI